MKGGDAPDANAHYSAPKVEERPVTEKRLTCPDDSELKYLSSGNFSTWGTGTITLTPAFQTDSGQRTWQSGGDPDAKSAVCVAKSDAIKGAE